MNIAIITGASGGLGSVFAKQLAQDESIECLWLCGRDQAKLEKVAAGITKETRLFPGDLIDESYRMSLKKALQTGPYRVYRLVNAAGFGIIGAFGECHRDDIIGQIEVNNLALVDMSYLVLPYMDRGTAIIQVSSVASFLPQTYFAIYAASKAFVSRFSYALAEELAPRGIRVMAVCPNPMATGFFERAGGGRGTGFKKIGFESPERVAEKALQRLQKRARQSITHPAGYILWFLGRVLPHRLVTWVERLFF